MGRAGGGWPRVQKGLFYAENKVKTSLSQKVQKLGGKKLLALRNTELICSDLRCSCAALTVLPRSRTQPLNGSL